MVTEQVHLDWLRAVLNLKEEEKSERQCLKQTVPNSRASIIKRSLTMFCHLYTHSFYSGRQDPEYSLQHCPALNNNIRQSQAWPQGAG